MNIRKFLLENEKGQQFKLDDIKYGCLLISPSNLGYSYKNNFSQTGFYFAINSKILEQKNPSGIAYFTNYDKVKEFIDYIESSLKLKMIYKLPFESGEIVYYKDIEFSKIDKTEKQNRWIACPVEFCGKSLWYEKNEIVYKIEKRTNERRWNWKWNARYTSYSNRNIVFENKGHVEAPFQVEIDGYIKNPKIEILVDGETYASIQLNIEIQEYEKFLYSSKTSELYIQKQKTDGTYENLFKKKYGVDLNNVNIFKLPLRNINN